MGMESFVSATDLHGDRADAHAVKLFKRFVDDFKPKFRLFLGDIFDFRPFRKKASEEEKRERINDDFAAGMAFLSWYRPNVITLGNHDSRMWDLLDRGGPLADLAEDKVAAFNRFAERHKILVLPYDKRKGVFRRNGLAFTHGFFSGKTAAAQMARVYGNVLFGHGHAIDVATEPGLSPRTARMTGCLCQLDMDYNRAQTMTLRQEHGWAYGAFIGRDRNSVFQATVDGGQVVYADRLKVVTT